MKAETVPALYQCVPNFSEGRRPDVITALAKAIAGTPGARLIDHSADVDHNRCVMTFLGDAEAVRRAVRAAARVAVARIDLRTHSGVHPRAGAIDVLPIVPLWKPEGGETGFFLPPPPHTPLREEAIDLAQTLGAELAQEFDLPVYLYEWAARPEYRSALPDLRKGGFEAFASVPLLGDLAPDFGPASVHPTAGVTIVGARAPLIAYNVNLETADLAIAQAIARRIRADRASVPELNGVRALGLFLASQNRAQVSFNLTRPERSPLPAVFAYVRDHARTLGTDACESEIIGVIPHAALAEQPPEALLWHDYKPSQILENALIAE